MNRALTTLLALLIAPAAAAQFLPPGAQTWTLFPADRVSQYVMEVGTAQAAGDTVVVVHGGFGAEHSGLIDPLLPLTDRYHFVFYDQRGSLRSPVPEGADSLLTFSALVEDLEVLRVQLGLRQLTILAHSMGAVITYGYLDRYPARVRGVALLAPGFPDLWSEAEDPPTDPRLVPPPDAAAARARFRQYNADTERRLEAVVAAEGFPDPDTLSMEQILRTPGMERALFNRSRAVTAAFNTCHPERWRDLRGMGRAFYSQRVADAVFSDANRPALEAAAARLIPAIEAYGGPVGIVAGDCDFQDPGGVIVARLAGLFPNAHLRVVPDAGHLFWIDVPDDSAALINEALRVATGRDDPR